MATINILGAGGHARVIMDIVRAQGDSVGALFDDNPHTAEIHGVPVVRTPDALPPLPVIIAIGSNRVREAVAARYPSASFDTAIHPTAIVAKTARIGEGTVVMHGAIIQTDASIGRHAIINTGASIDHECQIADFVHISPHATLCGNVHVGRGSWIGAGSVLIPGVKVGAGTTIGAGSVVVSDIPDGVVAFGNPCHIQRKI